MRIFDHPPPQTHTIRQPAFVVTIKKREMDPPPDDYRDEKRTRSSLVRMPYTDNPTPPPPPYSDDPPVGPPMSAFYSDDPSRARLDHRHDDWGIEGGDESVGMVGTTHHTNRFRGIVSDRFRKLVPVVCLLLVGFVIGIVFVNVLGDGDGSAGGVVAGGSEVVDTINNGEAGDGFDNYIDNDLNDGKEEDESVTLPTPAPLPYWTVHWCGSCDWNHVYTCDARKGWIMHRYDLTEIEAMEGLRDQCAVGETHAPSSHFSKKPTVSPTLSPEMLWWSHHWCGNCTWNNFTSCDSRKGYIIYRYHLKELEAMEDLREFCALATHSPSVSSQPSSMPSQDPTVSAAPSPQPSHATTSDPSARPTTAAPSGRPSMSPSTPKPSPSTSLSPTVRKSLLP
jgi:hypothetical protein